jgi:serine/threonine-protein phosphatase Stp1
MTAGQSIFSAALRTREVRCSAATHPGTRREHNEDAMLSRPDLGLWAVADGAGGHSGGKTAACAVVASLDTIPAGLTAGEMLAQVRLRLAGVHNALRDAAPRLGENAMMASTIVALVVREDHFACLWAGDSRAYLRRSTAVEQLTIDHSVVQDLVDRGAISAAEADGHSEANVITRAIGAAGVEPELDKRMGQVMTGDRFLLCSDGISKSLLAGELAEMLRDAAAAEEVVEASLRREAADNVSAILIDFLAPGADG